MMRVSRMLHALGRKWAGRRRKPARRAPRTEPLERRTLCAHGLAAAVNVGMLEGSKLYYGAVNPVTQPVEYHALVMEDRGRLCAWLVGLHANADLVLVKDLNHNGAVDAGEVLATSANPGTRSELISKPLFAGQYFVGVIARGGATSYQLSLTADYAGSTLSTSRYLGSITNIASASDFIGNIDSNDYYRFSISSARTVTAGLGPVSGSVGLQLINDANHDGVVEASEVMAATSVGRSGGAVSRAVPAGTYFVRVYRISGDSNYRLTVNAPTSANDANGGGLQVVFDYRYDASGFFRAHPDAVARLNDVAAVFSHFTDQLTGLVPAGGNTWSEMFANPANGQQVTIANPKVAANTLVIYVGGNAHLQSLELGQAAPGGWSATGSQDWLNSVESRGQQGVLAAQPTDFGPWGGAIAFSSLARWNFSAQPPQPGQNDFYSVALHEMCHVLGIGTSDSWQTWTNGHIFIGSHAERADGGRPVPLSPFADHWADGTMSTVGTVPQAAEMDPYLPVGQRRYLTALDYAGLQDVGWQVR